MIEAVNPKVEQVVTAGHFRCSMCSKKSGLNQVMLDIVIRTSVGRPFDAVWNTGVYANIIARVYPETAFCNFVILSRAKNLLYL